MTKRQWIILAVIFALLLLIVIQLFTGKKEAPSAGELSSDNKKYVKVHKIKNDTVPIFVEGFGRVASSRNINVSSEVQGVLQAGGVLLKPGQSFSQGQLLFKINDKEAQLALKARKSGFLNVVASILPDIKIDFPNNSAAWTEFLNQIELGKDLPNLPNFSSNKEKTFLAAKNVLAEYYNIKGDEERLKKYAIYAPFSGTILTVNAETGTSVSPGTPIATIIKTVALEVAIPVDPKDISLLKIGSKVDLSSEDKTMAWEGTVSRISQNINPNTQSVDVYVNVDNNSEALYNGMYIEAKIHADYVVGADEIPRRSFLNDMKVYLANDSMLIKKRPMVVKYYKNSMIVKGLDDGDLVVVEPIPGALDSMKVAPIINKLSKK
jgi:multidrug efflux pump subunit AcrA (membrane-fusion protein)